MTCTDIERLLDQQNPDADTLAAMQRHAAQCPDCRLLLDLRALDREEAVPEEASTRWRAAIRTEQARETQQHRNGFGFLKAKYLAPLCAVAAVLVAAVALQNPIGTIQKTAESTATAGADSKPAAVHATASPAMRATLMPSPVGTSLPQLTLSNGAAPKSLSANSAIVPEETAGAAEEPEMESAAEMPAANEILAGEAEEALPEMWDADEFPFEAAEEEAGVGVWEAEEASLKEAAFAVPAMFESASMDSGDAEDTLFLSWSADRPEERARTLLAAVGQEGREITRQAEGVRFTLAVERAEWEHICHALEAAGCPEVPGTANVSWNEDGYTLISVTIYEKEN